MKSGLGAITETLFSIGGAIILAIGTYLPWIRVRPGHDGPVPVVYISGMSSGLEAAGLPLLVLAGTVIILTVVSPQNGKSALLRVITGGLAVLFALLTMAQFTGVFVPALGVYLTLLGGVLLLVVGGIRVLNDPTVNPWKTISQALHG